MKIKEYLTITLGLIVFSLIISCSKTDGTSTTTNHPPSTPVNIFPLNASTTVTPDTLKWAPCTDPDGDAVTYDVYLGTTVAVTLQVSSLNKTWYKLYGITPKTLYYWKIVARDSHSSTADGPLYHFTTP
jgi:hypothetical protein